MFLFSKQWRGERRIRKSCGKHKSKIRGKIWYVCRFHHCNRLSYSLVATNFIPSLSGHSTDSNSSITADSKSPAPEDKSRESSKENLSDPVSSGPRVRSHRPSNYNRTKIYRNLKKNNGENQRQSDDPTINAHSTNANKLSHSNYHTAKATKRPQI